MPSQAEIARDWDCTRAYVWKQVKRGCPTDSLEAARNWRELNCAVKPPCAPKPEGFEGPGKGVNVKTGTLAAPKQARADMIEPAQPSKKRRRSMPRRPSTGDSFLDTLNKAMDAFDEVNVLLSEAMEEGNVAKTSTLLSIHNKALMAQFEAQKRYREEMERRRDLVNLADAKAITRKGFEVFLRRLGQLAQKMSGQLNPTEPLNAYNLLEKEANGIIEEASRVYAPENKDSSFGGI